MSSLNAPEIHVNWIHRADKNVLPKSMNVWVQ